MRGPRPLTAEDLASRPRIVDAVEFVGTEDPAEIERTVAAWVQEHGPYTHFMMWCGPQVITTTGEPTTVLVPVEQFVVPCPGPGGADIVPYDPAAWAQKRRARQVLFMSWCYLPLIAATNRPEDAPWLVRLRKLGATQLLCPTFPTGPGCVGTGRIPR